MAIREFNGPQDESWYMQWIERNQDGYVLNTTRPNPSKSELVLHMATCWSISTHQTGKRRFTGGGYQKVGSIDKREVERWARDKAGAMPKECPHCKP